MNFNKQQKIAHEIAMYANETANKMYKIEAKDSFRKQLAMVQLYFLGKIDTILADYCSENPKNFIINNSHFTLHNLEFLISIGIDAILTSLAHISANPRDICNFFEKIMLEFVKFYADPENEIKYLMGTVCMVRFSEIMNLNPNYSEEKIIELIKNYDKYINYIEQHIDTTSKKLFLERHEIACEILKRQTPMLDNLDLFGKFGLNVHFMHKISYQYQEYLLEKEIKKQNQSPIFLNLTSSEKKDIPVSIDIASIKEELSLLLDIHTMSPVKVLKPEEISRVMELLNILGYDTKLAKENIRSFHNEIKKNELEQVKKSLMVEEDLELYNALKTFIYQNNINAYTFVIQKNLEEIDLLIDEYKKEGSNVLLLDYQEQILLILNDLKVFVPYLNLGLKRNLNIK